MCLIAFAIGGPDSCPFLLASNRDEWWQRPTQPLAQWHTPRGQQVWSGRDETAGGTWLGFNAQGRVAMLTNVRPAQQENAPQSRGRLVLEWLEGAELHATPTDFLEHHRPQAYNGFNLVLGDVRFATWWWLSNREPSDTPAPALGAGWWGHPLAPGIYGLSNAHLDTPWPKALALKAALAQSRTLLANGTAADWRAPLLQTLTRLPDADPTDPEPRWETTLASPFVYAPARRYGTRSSLLARARRGPRGTALELEEWSHPVADAPLPASQSHWPLERSTQRVFSISTWGMPTSS